MCFTYATSVFTLQPCYFASNGAMINFNTCISHILQASTRSSTIKFCIPNILIKVANIDTIGMHRTQPNSKKTTSYLGLCHVEQKAIVMSIEATLLEALTSLCFLLSKCAMEIFEAFQR